VAKGLLRLFWCLVNIPLYQSINAFGEVLVVRKILLTLFVILASLVGAFVTNLIMEYRMKPNYDLVEYDPDSNSMNDMVAEMETSERQLAPVTEIELPLDAEIIAVQVKGRHYAFPKLFMEGVGDHIASDVFEGVPLAVTYCNETECVRVFSDNQSDKKIKLDQFGLQDGGLAVQLNGKIYPQESEEIPLEDYSFTLVNWSEWKSANPDGLVLTEQIWDVEPEASLPELE
tara:strand:- start:472 stop:1161 length:690 start_codon:yes stop_codon:yes gene_type:complete